MKHISCLRDLEPHGIEILTGEACGLMMRVLCDVTKSGRSLFIEAYGLDPDTKLGDPWNSGSKENPHVGSIMLAPDDYKTLGVFALLRTCSVVYQFYPAMDTFERLREQDNSLRAIAERIKQVGTEFEPRGVADGKPNWSLEAAMVAGARHGIRSIVSEHSLLGYSGSNEEEVAAYLNAARKDGWTWRSYRSAGTAGNRNVHMMSGRIT